MRFYPLIPSAEAVESGLSSEYKAAHAIGKLRLGELRLFFRAGLKTYYIPYRDIRRCFRRVMLIPAKVRGGQRDVAVETLVVCGEKGELAQIQLPGGQAAKELLAELEKRIPEAEFGKPSAD